MAKYENNSQYIKFVEEIVDDVLLVSENFKEEYEFHKATGQFTFKTCQGIVDFYAHNDKYQIRKKVKWRTGGLKKLLEIAGAEKQLHENRFNELKKYFLDFGVVIDDDRAKEIVNIVKRIK